MQLAIDDKTGELTVPAKDKAAEVLRLAATVERVLAATENDADDARQRLEFADELQAHARELVPEPKEPLADG